MVTFEFSKDGGNLWDFRDVLGEVKERTDKCMYIKMSATLGRFK
jgi:hypothetical protein